MYTRGRFPQVTTNISLIRKPEADQVEVTYHHTNVHSICDTIRSRLAISRFFKTSATC